MPDTQQAPEGVSAALQPDPDVTIPRIKLTEQGFVGLRTMNGYILEETNRAFRFPAFIKTVNEMRVNPTVGAAMDVYRFMMTRVKWCIEAPVGATSKELARAKAVASMMGDMESSWEDFISSVVPYIEYGFGIHEMVLRRRLYRNGSKYNDGLVGLSKIAPRNQETIHRWIFDESGSELVRVEQSLMYLENAVRFIGRTNANGLLEIPREKFLLFTSSPTKGNPQGNSIYKNIYLAYKQLSLLQDQQLVGVAKDVQGILKIGVPVAYLDPNADADHKATMAAFQGIIDNYNAGTSRGLLVPLLNDPDTKTPLFTYELMASKGTSPYNIESIIRGLQGDILSALNVDILKLGADGTGSFSLASAKSSILALAIDSRLKEIAGVLNHHLMRTLFEQNGWETTNMPKFTYAEPEEIDLEAFSAAVQRIFAVSAVEVDRPVLNRVRDMLGVARLPDDEPVHVDRLPASIADVQSKSGAGLAVGTTGEGTAKNAINGGGDASVANKANS